MAARGRGNIINIGAYVPGSNPEIDDAIGRIGDINRYLAQGVEERGQPLSREAAPQEEQDQISRGQPQVGAQARLMSQGLRKLTGVIANLSRHGMLLVTPGPLSSPSVIVQVASDRQVVQLFGETVWTRRLDHGCHGAGVEFIARFGRISRG